MSVWLTHILDEIIDVTMEPSILFTDNQSLKDLAYSMKGIEEKRLRTDIAAI